MFGRSICVRVWKVAGIYPLPRIQECIDKLGKASHLSSMYMVSGYWQLRVLGKEKTALTPGMGNTNFRISNAYHSHGYIPVHSMLEHVTRLVRQTVPDPPRTSINTFCLSSTHVLIKKSWLWLQRLLHFKRSLQQFSHYSYSSSNVLMSSISPSRPTLSSINIFNASGGL